MKEKTTYLERENGFPHANSNSTNSYFPSWTVRYGECQKNHAANLGGYAVDGCREFMPWEEGTNGQLTCAACGCHRDFHRAMMVAVAAEVVSDCSFPTSETNNS